LIDRIRQGGKLCQVSVSAQGALTILRELGGCGLLLVVNEALTPRQGEELLAEVYRVEKTNNRAHIF
jgi:hypothetical protein